MKRLLFFILLAASSSFSFAQSLTHEQITSFSYEDASDILRRFPGMYPMDYGVLGAPVILRPWGLSPWLIGAERDGIPWNRVSDGLWNSNLDMPDEMDTLRIEHNGTEPFGRFTWSRRVVPSDSPRTELHVREGYYGFGRIDFAHAQRFSPKLDAEASGRLNWYDGMRTNISKARLYNLRGSLTYSLSDAWKAILEYGGANSDVQSPHTITIDTLTGVKTRISVFDEREYGTLRVKKQAERHSLDFGVHLRQDRENHDDYFRLREQLWYGFAGASLNRGPWSGSAKLDYEHAEMDFPGAPRYLTLDRPCALVRVMHSSEVGSYEISSTSSLSLTGSKDGNTNLKAFDGELATAINANGESPQIAGLSAVACGVWGSQLTPHPYWSQSDYLLAYRPLQINNAMSDFDRVFRGEGPLRDTSEHDGGNLSGVEGGLRWSSAPSIVDVRFANWSLPVQQFTIDDSSLYYQVTGGARQVVSAFHASCDLPLASFLRLQSWSFVQLDNEDYSRAMDTRSYSRLLFEKDFLEAPLHIASFVAYEHIGRHEATSDIATETLGPAHLMHVQIAATIHGVTLLWGVDNLTGQHYYYLPGYPMIAKEEYFGLRWTLTL